MQASNHNVIKVIKQKYSTTRFLPNGLSVVFRPIDYLDQKAFKVFVESLSDYSLHFRFFGIIKDLPDEVVERFCNIDYGNEMAIAAFPYWDNKTIVGIARIHVFNRRGEFAIMVSDSWQGLGLGGELLKYIFRISGDYGVDEIYCFVSRDNIRMLRLAARMGLKVKSVEDDMLEMFTHPVDVCDEVPIA